MASHLTIISGTSGASASTRAFTGQQAGAQDATSEPKGLLGLFAALLNGSDANAVAQTVPSGLSADRPGNQTGTGLAGLFRLVLQDGIEAETGDGATDNSNDPDAIAAAMDLVGLTTTAADPKPMVDFVEALGALKASLDRGEPLDPDLLNQVEGALTALADALGLELEDLAVPDDFAALLETTEADETGLAGALTQLLAPLAQSLSTMQPATDATQIASAPAADAQLKSLNDKLAALLAALEQGDVAAEKLASLGMAPDEPLDAEIEAALARFASGLATASSVPEEPVLATPALKLSEPVLTGKSTALEGAGDNTEATTARTGLAQPSTEQDPAQQHAGSDRNDRPDPASRETRTNPNAAAAAVDASNIPAPSADASAAQPAGARIDASANPRIIQAGYQTSQQQLNLPQIAFELARQVQDGNTRFQIRLDPPELGRIDVRLDINDTGQVNARLVVEKAETLDLMQRDQRGLERALQQAGLDGAKTNLEFSLKQNPFAGQQGQMGEGKGQGGSDSPASANDNGSGNGEAETAPPMVNLYRGGLQASGVNIIA